MDYEESEQALQLITILNKIDYVYSYTIIGSSKNVYSQRDLMKKTAFNGIN